MNLHENSIHNKFPHPGLMFDARTANDSDTHGIIVPGDMNEPSNQWFWYIMFWLGTNDYHLWPPWLMIVSTFLDEYTIKYQHWWVDPHDWWSYPYVEWSYSHNLSKLSLRQFSKEPFSGSVGRVAGEALKKRSSHVAGPWKFSQLAINRRENHLQYS